LVSSKTIGVGSVLNENRTDTNNPQILEPIIDREWNKMVRKASEEEGEA